ncbi:MULTISPECIES: hypothetical protein [Rhizobium/Agrobacterium group]|nr:MULTISPECIES: hypothetical protein [Rhizobium/Agrobacterium group]NSZ66836.1 hypothetical protein [Agrobacterium tumefaciens]NTA19574.1 hypothetical protein [Agrobacterium tumefaciens]NTA73285.1 hypothetical protein [Agrobacterium tumefaciens]NTJ11956.1 hypothetical protein [Rhizobium lusitanum]WCK75052.1 hypothetical protein G6L96_027810 [Agrobacterium tumefaciens]
MTLPSIKLTAYPQSCSHHDALAEHHAISPVMNVVMLEMTVVGGARVNQDDRFASIAHMIRFRPTFGTRCADCGGGPDDGYIHPPPGSAHRSSARTNTAMIALYVDRSPLHGTRSSGAPESAALDVNSIVIKVTNNNKTISKFELYAKIAIFADGNRIPIKPMVAEFVDCQIADFPINT